MIRYEDYDAIGLAALIREGALTPRDATEAAIGRIEALDPQLNTVVTRLYEAARETIARPATGPFAGVPLLLKDIGGDVAGVETRSGSRFKAGRQAACDHTLVARYRKLGFVILGKTNVPELGMNPVTTSVLYGPARNPWSLDHSAGGSSGGSAAAVAAGLVPVAHGGDAGGSIRMPASCCGLVGLKPTRGRNPSGPLAGEVMSGFLQEHVLTRTVRDCAAVLDGTCGPEPGDPYCAPPVRGRFADAAERAPRPLRIAMWTSGPEGEASHPDCVQAVASTAALLEELGHRVEPAVPPGWAEICTRAMVIAAAQIAHEIDTHAAASGRAPSTELLEPRTWSLYEAGRRLTAADYLSALAAVQSAGRRVAEFMQRYDTWMTPTLPGPPPRLEADPDGTAGASGDFSAIAFAVLANATGQPSISLPLGMNGEGLPIGVMFTGRFGDEAGLFSLAAQLEAATPWRGRRPPVWT